jgi:hypothetical protein
MQEPAPYTVAAAPAAPFDPLSVEEVHSGELRVKNPLTGEATGMVIVLAGPEHPDRKRRIFTRTRRMRAAWQKTGKMPVTDPEEDAAEELDDLVACTLGWRGAVVPYSADAARTLYADSKRRWLREQVKQALGEAELFTRSSAPT